MFVCLTNGFYTYMVQFLSFGLMVIAFSRHNHTFYSYIICNCLYLYCRYRFIVKYVFTQLFLLVIVIVIKNACNLCRKCNSNRKHFLIRDCFCFDNVLIVVLCFSNYCIAVIINNSKNHLVKCVLDSHCILIASRLYLKKAFQANFPLSNFLLYFN